MAKRTDVRIKNINNFLKVAKQKIEIEKVILFGSYNKNKAKKDSDIDIAIISRDFQKKNLINRLVLLGKIAWESRTTIIEPLGFTPEEYKNAQPWEFIYEITKTGKVIYSK